MDDVTFCPNPAGTVLPRGSTYRIDVVKELAVLAEEGETESLRGLLQNVDAPDADVRKIARQAISKCWAKRQIRTNADNLGDHRAVPSLGRIAREEGRSFIRLIAVEALSRINDPRAIRPLIDCLSDPDPVVHSVTHQALLERGTEVVPHVVRYLLSDTGLRSKDSLLAYLQDVPGYIPRDTLHEIYSQIFAELIATSADRVTRAALLIGTDALIGLASYLQLAVPPLEEQRTTTSCGMEENFLRSLTSATAETAVAPKLWEVLAFVIRHTSLDDRSLVLYEAVSCLAAKHGRLNGQSDECIERTMKFVVRKNPKICLLCTRSPNNAVRRGILDAARRWRRSDVRLLAALVTDPEPLIRRKAVEALAERPGQASLHYICEVLKDDDFELRQHALRQFVNMIEYGGVSLTEDRLVPLLPQLVEMLQDDLFSRVASKVLADGIKASRTFLEQFLDEYTRPGRPAVQCRWPAYLPLLSALSNRANPRALTVVVNLLRDQRDTLAIGILRAALDTASVASLPEICSDIESILGPTEVRAFGGKPSTSEASIIEREVNNAPQQSLLSPWLIWLERRDPDDLLRGQ